MKTIFLCISLVMGVSRGFAQFNTFLYETKNGNQIMSLSEGQQQGNSEILIGATSEILSETAPNGTFPNATNAFLIRTKSGKHVLIDAGYGRELLNNLRFYDVSPDMIDAVLLTHMHGDHIGGLLNSGGLRAFPNAQLYVAKPEYDYFCNGHTGKPSQNLAHSVATAYSEKLVLFEPGEFLYAAVIEALPCFGHTPGHTAFLIDEVLIWGDIAHAMAVQMPYPNVSVKYDTDPEQAKQSRIKMLDYVIKNKFAVAGMHIAFPGIGTVSENGVGGYIFVPMD